MQLLKEPMQLHWQTIAWSQCISPSSLLSSVISLDTMIFIIVIILIIKVHNIIKIFIEKNNFRHCGFGLELLGEVRNWSGTVLFTESFYVVCYMSLTMCANVFFGVPCHMCNMSSIQNCLPYEQSLGVSRNYSVWHCVPKRRCSLCVIRTCIWWCSVPCKAICCLLLAIWAECAIQAVCVPYEQCGSGVTVPRGLRGETRRAPPSSTSTTAATTSTVPLLPLLALLASRGKLIKLLYHHWSVTTPRPFILSYYIFL